MSAPVREPRRGAHGAARRAEAAGIAAEDVALRRPTLDEVFLHLTGHAADGRGGGGMTLRWALADAWVIARRDLTHWVMEPLRVVWAVVFPIVFILLFGYVFGSGMAPPEGGDYLDFLIPGLFVTTMAFSIAETVTAVTVDKDKGVMDRFRSMPMAPSAIVVGRSVADLVNALLALVVMVLCGLAVGWGWHEGLGSALAAFALLLLLRFALQWVGIYLGLLIRSPEGVAAMQGLLFPFTILASTYVGAGADARRGSGPSRHGTRSRRRSARCATCSATRAGRRSPGSASTRSGWPWPGRC